MIGSGGRPTSRDVARLAGVSQATVSRVLQNSPLVQPATRQAVLDAIAQSGYAPNAAARWMRTRRTGIIALVVANLAVNPLYPAMLQLLSAALRKRGLSASVYEEEDFSDATMRVMVESGVDGVITTTATEASLPLLERIAQKVPLVLLHRTVGSDAFDQFSSDNRASGASTAGFFVDHGRTRIGLISGHERGLARLEKKLAEPKRVVDTFGALFARPIGSDLLGMATGEALAHLNCLIRRGRIARTTDGEGVAWYAAISSGD